MSRYITISELPNHPELGVRVVICANSETVCDGRDLDNWHDEATRAATCAAAAALPVDYEVDSCFANWHGGKYCRADVRCGHVVADLYRRDITRDDAGDQEVGEWAWCGREGFPAEALAEVAAMLDAASTAHEAALVEQEALHAEREINYALDHIADGGDADHPILATALELIDRNPELEQHRATIKNYMTAAGGADVEAVYGSSSSEVSEASHETPEAVVMVPITREADSLTEPEIAELRAMPSAKRRKSWLYHHGVRRSPELMQKIAGTA